MTVLEEQKNRFSETEAEIYQEVRDFKADKGGVSEWTTEAIDDRLESLADRLGETSPGDAADKVAGAILNVINDVSIWSVREHKIWENFQDAGYEVESLEDVRRLDLDEVEDALGRLELKYRAAAFAEGVSVGAFGLVGILADLPTIVAMGLRAIAEYATYYGVDPTHPVERPFDLLVLAASAASGEARREVFARIDDYAASLDEAGSDEDLPAAVTSEVVEQLAVRLVRGKIGQSLPLAGALLGGSYNQAFVRHVCKTAHQVYRERWLLRRHVAQ